MIEVLGKCRECGGTVGKLASPKSFDDLKPKCYDCGLEADGPIYAMKKPEVKKEEDQNNERNC